MMAGPPTTLPPPRYKALADLDYIYSGVGIVNYSWFQFRLHVLADSAFEEVPFPVVISRLKAAFPATEGSPVPLDEILHRLEKLRPGMTKLVDDLKGPSTIRRVVPGQCAERKSQTGEAFLVVRNDTDEDVTIQVDESPPAKVGARTWQSFRARTGSISKFPDDRCLEFTAEPGLAVLTTR
jgi:hypothetical protein